VQLTAPKAKLTPRDILANLPNAVSGAGGHDATLRAACECVRLGLSDGEAMALLRDWNGTHCQPPWTEKELAHKLASARSKAGGQVRPAWQPKPAERVVWKIVRKQPAATPAEPVKPIAPPQPPAATAEPPRLWVIKPGEPIPAMFADVLRTWPAFRNHPAWINAL